MAFWRQIFLWVMVLILGASLCLAQNPGDARAAFAQGEPILPAQDKVAIIHLDASVDNVMLYSLKRRVDLALKAGCAVIVFDIDSTGGQASSGIEISKYLKELADKRKVITVAWIHDRAIAEGAMIAAACQHVVISSGGVYGNCRPIAVKTTMIGTKEATSLPAVVTEFDDSAVKNKWDHDLLRAMVVEEAQVHQIRNRATGAVKYVGSEKKDEFLALQEDAPGGGKISNWQYVKTIDDASGVLTASGQEALQMKLADAPADNETMLLAALNVRGDSLRLEYNWLERTTIFLTSPYIRFLLFVGMLVLAWAEFSHPGFSIFGIGALICLVLLVGAPYLTGLAQIWEIALIVIGVAIIIADLWAFGGIGLLAAPGFILVAIGLVASFIPNDPAGGMERSHQVLVAAEEGLGVVIGGSFFAIGLFYVMSKYLAVTPGFRHLQLVPGGGRRAA
ncbi:MAG TPA: hypothetical protein VHM90_21455, partial [Phycisphaerae bacterium]|nr:hypothetical protein [Phycisphaerae bacterium]